jgi:2,5-furandicarboxylate decarboxylase 1
MVIAVDNDIDIHDPHDVEYALATRMEASKDLVVVPGARGHEYVRIGKDGIRAKLAIDATVPFNQKARFTRVKFLPSEIDESRIANDANLHVSWLK